MAKYNFVYDDGFFEKAFVQLSLDELKVVMATVLGGHHAIFYGYKPERLANAVKILRMNPETTPFVEVPYTSSLEKLCGGGEDLHKGLVSEADKGFLYTPNINDLTYSELSILSVVMKEKRIHLSRAGNNITHNADFQLVATSSSCNCGGLDSDSHTCICSSDTLKRWWNKSKSITEQCAIFYKCRSNDLKISHSVAKLKKDIAWAWNNHKEFLNYEYIERGYYPTKNCELQHSNHVHFSGQAKDLYRDLMKNGRYSEKTLLNFARVARTFADIAGHSLTYVNDLNDARTLYNNCVPYTE